MMTSQQIAMSFSLCGSIFSLGIIAGIGFIAQKSNLFGENGRKIMGDVMLKITFPCLGFHSMVTTVDPAQFSQNVVSVIMGMLILTVGLVVGYIAVIPLRIEARTRNTFVHLMSTCNYFFLPLPIVIALWPAQEGAMFLHSLGCGLVYWVVGIYPLTKGQGIRKMLTNIFNRPMLSMIAGLVVAYLGGGEYLKTSVTVQVFSVSGLLHTLVVSSMQSLRIIGAATIPLALLFVGAALASARSKISKRLLLYYSFMRLIAFPMLFIPIIKYSGLPTETAFVPLLISMMPASNISTLIAHRFGGDENLASAANLWSTPLALCTVPFLFPFLSDFL